MFCQFVEDMVSDRCKAFVEKITMEKDQEMSNCATICP